MSYLVKLPDGAWLARGRPVTRIDLATLFPHPSAAKTMLERNPGAKLVPFEQIKDEWYAARASVE